MGRRKTAHDTCRRIAAVKFDGDNYICAGESLKSTYPCDSVRLCIKGAVQHRVQEMTVREAVTIRDCLSEVIRQLGQGLSHSRK
jgi:hypothetical protein